MNKALFSLIAVTALCAGCTCAVNPTPYGPLTYRQWYELPVAKKQTYLEDTIPTVELEYDGDIAEITESLDELYTRCDKDCRAQDMTYILDNLMVMYTLK